MASFDNNFAIVHTSASIEHENAGLHEYASNNQNGNGVKTTKQVRSKKKKERPSSLKCQERRRERRREAAFVKIQEAANVSYNSEKMKSWGVLRLFSRTFSYEQCA